MLDRARQYNSLKPSATVPLSQLLGLGSGDVRLLNPRLQQTTGKNPKFFIRPLIERPGPGGTVTRSLERIYIEADGKKEALKERARILETLNRRDVMLAAQVNFGELLKEYTRRHVRRPGILSASTQAKYECHLANHIRPAFETVPLGMMTSRKIEEWLDGKTLAYATKLDLRNIMASIFSKAEEWGYLRDRKNPAASVHLGRPQVARPRAKLTNEQTRKLLDALHPDVRFLCELALCTTLRISEIFGVQEGDIDTVAGTIQVRRRFYRGDLDRTKSVKGNRVVSVGHLLPAVVDRLAGDPERFPFFVRTKTTRTLKSGEVRTGYEGRVSRDDRDILQHFLRPAAKALGVYYTGFGLHAFRVEAITELGKDMNRFQVQRMAGHAAEEMTQHYTLADLTEQDRAVRKMQERVLGMKKPAKKKVGAA